MMHRDMFTVANGDRPGVPNIALVMTDGESVIDPQKTVPEAEEARAKGIDMIAIAIGDEVTESF